MYQSVLVKPRDLDEDIYDLTEEKSDKYDHKFYVEIISKYKTVREFLRSETWQKFKERYHEKYSR